MHAYMTLYFSLSFSEMISRAAIDLFFTTHIASPDPPACSISWLSNQAQRKLRTAKPHHLIIKLQNRLM